MSIREGPDRRARISFSYTTIFLGLLLVLSTWIVMAIMPFYIKSHEIIESYSGINALMTALNCLFSGLAFLAIFSTLRIQTEQFRIQKHEIEQNLMLMQDTIKREESKDFEGRFFQLLKSLGNIVADTHYNEESGRKAFAELAKKLNIKIDSAPGTSSTIVLAGLKLELEKIYQSFWDGDSTSESASASLGHYFRLLFHIVQFIDKSSLISDDQKQFYIRILRANLSDYELLLLFYNGLSVYGEAFYPLIEKYQLLHNMSTQILTQQSHVKFYPNLEKYRQEKLQRVSSTISPL